jgi:hypothetical protein
MPESGTDIEYAGSDDGRGPETDVSKFQAEKSDDAEREIPHPHFPLEGAPRGPADGFCHLVWKDQVSKPAIHEACAKPYGKLPHQEYLERLHTMGTAPSHVSEGDARTKDREEERPEIDEEIHGGVLTGRGKNDCGD